MKAKKLLAQNTRLNAIGNLSNLPPDIRELLGRVMKMTEKCDSLTITLALSYGGREEIINAVNNIIAEGGGGNGNRGGFSGISIYIPTARTGSAYKDWRGNETFQFSAVATGLCRNIRYENSLAEFQKKTPAKSHRQLPHQGKKVRTDRRADTGERTLD